MVFTEGIRLRGSANERQGRLEVNYGGVWGTVCDASWTDRNAEVSLGIPLPDECLMYNPPLTPPPERSLCNSSVESWSFCR